LNLDFGCAAELCGKHKSLPRKIVSRSNKYYLSNQKFLCKVSVNYRLAQKTWKVAVEDVMYTVFEKKHPLILLAIS